MTSATALYTKDILRWAASLPPRDRLDAPSGTAERRSPTCGSAVRADVKLAEGQIADAAFKVHACALGQASAAMLLARAPGMSLADVEQARAALEAGLTGKSPWPDHWEELALLSAARDYPGRHAALLIGYDALLAAARNAEG